MSLVGRDFIEFPTAWYALEGRISAGINAERPVFSDSTSDQWRRVMDNSGLELSFSNESDLEEYLTSQSFSFDATNNLWISDNAGGDQVWGVLYDQIRVITQTPINVQQATLIQIPDQWFSLVGREYKVNISSMITLPSNFIVSGAHNQDWYRVVNTLRSEISFASRQDVEDFLEGFGFVDSGQDDIWVADPAIFLYTRRYDRIRVTPMRIMY